MKVFLYVMLAIGLIGAIATCGDDSPSEEKKKENKKIEYTAEMDKTISTSEYEGWTKVKSAEREIWVEPWFWNTLDYDQKLGLGYVAAVKCANDLNSDRYYASVRDMKTGKKLANWDADSGFEMEE